MNDIAQEYLQKKVVGVGVMWAAMLRLVMSRTGKGYSKPSLKHTGVGADRRKDKLARPMRKCFRRYEQRYA